MSFKSAYFKLTIFYVGIVMIISVSFSVILYGISSRELNTGLFRQGRMLRELSNVRNIPKSFAEMEKLRSNQLNESNSHLKLNLIYFNIFVFFISGGVSYLLAKRTLSPIEEMVDLQNRFTADASHELRTPLTAIRTEIEVGLRDKNFNIADAKKLLLSNLEEIAKLESLSSGLLTLSRYQEMKKISFSAVSSKEIFSEVHKKVKNIAKDKNIDLLISDANFSIKGDKRSLIELFIILTENAIKYSFDGKQVVVSLDNIGKNVIVKIEDQGIGIKASDLPYIFNRFYRADFSRSKQKADGYGLGLSIAKKIVDLHHGKIEFESKPHQGTIFLVKLPIN